MPEMLRVGGVVMWIILACSVVACINRASHRGKFNELLRGD